MIKLAKLREAADVLPAADAVKLFVAEVQGFASANSRTHIASRRLELAGGLNGRYANREWAKHK